MDVILRSFCDRLLAAPTVVALVGTRVYPAHISTFSEVEYPCMTVFRLPGEKASYAPLRDFEVYVSGWAHNPDDAWTLMEAAQTIFDGTAATVGTVVYETLVVSSPYSLPDPDSVERITQTLIRVAVFQCG